MFEINPDMLKTCQLNPSRYADPCPIHSYYSYILLLSPIQSKSLGLGARISEGLSSCMHSWPGIKITRRCPPDCSKDTQLKDTWLVSAQEGLFSWQPCSYGTASPGPSLSIFRSQSKTVLFRTTYWLT